MNVKLLKNILLSWIQVPTNLYFILGMLFIAIGMAVSHHFTIYNSDDVVWQNALLGWHPFSGDTFYGDSDVGFILQAPLYWLTSLFVEPGRRAMFIDGLALNLITFSLFYWSAIYFLRIAKVKLTYITLTPLLWVSTLGFYLDRLFLGANLHNLVVGLIFAFLVLITKLCRLELKTHKKSAVVMAVAVVLLVAFSMVNDRYFVYFGIAPAILLVAIYAYKRMIDLKKASLITLLIILGYFTSKLLTMFLSYAGLILLKGVGDPVFVEFDNIIAYTLNTVHAYLMIMGADFFGRSVGTVTVVAIFNFIIAALVVVAAARTAKLRKVTPELLAILGIFILNIVAYTFSHLSLGILVTYRYLIIVPFVAAILMSFYLSQTTRKTLYGALFLGAIVLNIILGLVGGSAYTTQDAENFNLVKAQNSNQSENYRMIDTVQKEGAKKGYASFWNSNINTYFSKDTVRFLPVGCTATGQTVSRPWFITKQWYFRPASESFYVLDTSPLDPTCTADQVIQQFGPPEKVIPFNEHQTIYFYNYDLIERIDTTNLP